MAADTTIKVEVDVNQANTALTRLQTNINNLGGKVSAMREPLLGFINGWTAAATVVTAFVTRTINLADSIQDLSDATGVASGALLNLRGNLIDAGGTSDDMEKIVTKLSTTLGEAAQGNEKVRKSFRDLGIALGDSNGRLRSTNDLLPEVIDALAKIQDPALRSATAVDLLGKSAAKIDWTKVSVINDPFKSEYIAQIAYYRGELDKLATLIEEKLIVRMGRLAEAIRKGPIEAIKELTTLLEFLPVNAINDWLLKQLDIDLPAIREKLKGLFKGVFPGEDTIERETAGLLRRFPANRPGQGRTGPLALTDESRTAIAAAKIQTEQLRQQTYEALGLATYMNDITDQYMLQNRFGELQFNILKSNAQIDSEARNKIAEYQRQIKTETANTNRDSRVTAAIVSEIRERIAETAENADLLKGIREEELRILDRARTLEAARANELQRTVQLYDQQLQRAQTLQDILRGARAQAGGVAFERGQMTRGPIERQIAQAYEDARRAAQEAAQQFAATFPEDMTAAQAEELAQGLDAIARAFGRVAFETENNILISQQWRTGWEEAFASYSENAQNAAGQARTYFETFTRGFEDAIVRFVQTGKLSFKDLVNTMIAEFARLQAQKMFLALFGDKTGGGMLFNLFNFGKSLFGMANGGSVNAGKSYMVGERGPEMFLPFTNGKIIPNNQLTGGNGQTPVTNVNYTIQAVDAQSFRSLVARDPAFIYAVTERGRQSQPSRRFA